MLRRLGSADGPELSVANAVRLSDQIADLAITAALEAGRDHELSRGEGDLLHRVQSYIDANLDDPTLGPDGIATEFFVSVRTLHRIFARQDLTVSGWIKQRRLEACRRALCAPGAGDVPINEVARRFGFTRAPVFSREFVGHYGETPSEYRRRHEGR